LQRVAEISKLNKKFSVGLLLYDDGGDGIHSLPQEYWPGSGGSYEIRVFRRNGDNVEWRMYRGGIKATDEEIEAEIEKVCNSAEHINDEL